MADQEQSQTEVKMDRIVQDPVITEKTYNQFQRDNQYTFVVAEQANKIEVKKSVENLYGVQVKDVRIIRVKPETVFVRGRKGVKSGYKKAIVSLQSGYSINF